MIIWVSHAWSWYWYIHAACGVLSCFKLEARIPLNYVLLCDCLEPIIDDFIRPECCKRQSNFYIAIRWDSAQWSLACLECSLRCSLFIIAFSTQLSVLSWVFLFTKCWLGLLEALYHSLCKVKLKNLFFYLSVEKNLVFSIQVFIFFF